MPAGLEDGTWQPNNALATPLLADGIAVALEQWVHPLLGELDWRVALQAMGSLTVVRMILPVVLAMLVHET